MTGVQTCALPIWDNSEEEEKEENFVEPESSTVVVESQVVVQETAEVIEEKTENAEEELIETVEEQVIQTVEEVVEDIKEQPVSEEAPSVYQAESALSSEEEDLVPTYEVPEPPSPPVYKADNSTMKFFYRNCSTCCITVCRCCYFYVLSGFIG